MAAGGRNECGDRAGLGRAGPGREAAGADSGVDYAAGAAAPREEPGLSPQSEREGGAGAASPDSGVTAAQDPEPAGRAAPRSAEPAGARFYFLMRAAAAAPPSAATHACLAAPATPISRDSSEV
ncbi:testis-specific gene A8 protein-like [Schistocerca cancellata]|uniref:testis-specific gene A8 protein-like n=1 Tax=Schistocerca cancellata TaxID=274614 RepID=UPI002118DB1D|nr:testis-specific gene A8 protein-like [Schistocerca cancellata]